MRQFIDYLKSSLNIQAFRASKNKIIIILFFVSLTVRVGFLIPVITFDVPVAFDEVGYYSRATGFSNVLNKVLSEHSFSVEDANRAYGGGKWPPLHPLLLAVGLFAFGEDVSYARLMVVILSFLTTLLVYFLTLRLSTRKAAISATLLHIFYPSFIAYSHYLWSETTYIFLILCSLYYVILTLENQKSHRKKLYAGVAGFFLGLSGLVRASVLPFLLIIPLSFAFSFKKISDKVKTIAVVTIMSFIVLLPWLLALRGATGRFVPIANTGGYNLYLGNNPWVPDGYGSSTGDAESKDLVRQSILEYSELNQVEYDVAARILAVDYIKQDVKGFLKRSGERLRMLWVSDFFALRHIFHTVYPPMSQTLVIFIGSIILSSYLIYIALVIWGFLVNNPSLHHKGLILTLLVAGMIPSIITISMSRLHIPLLALLLPVGGHGLANLRLKTTFNRRIVAVLLFFLFFLFIFPSYQFIPKLVRPSSYYAGLINPFDSQESSVLFTDTVILKSNNIDFSDHLMVTIINDNYWFDSEESQDISWKVTSENRSITLNIISRNPQESLQLMLSAEKGERTTIVQPITDLAWRQWQPTEFTGIEYKWVEGND